MLFTKKVSNTHQQLCIQQMPPTKSKELETSTPTTSANNNNDQDRLTNDDDSSSSSSISSMVDTTTVVPRKHQRFPVGVNSKGSAQSSSSKASMPPPPTEPTQNGTDKKLPSAVVALKPRVAGPKPASLSEFSSSQCIRRNQVFIPAAPLPNLLQQNLFSPPAPALGAQPTTSEDNVARSTHSSDDEDDVPDLIPEGHPNQFNSVDSNNDKEFVRSSWPTYTQPPNLASCLKKDKVNSYTGASSNMKSLSSSLRVSRSSTSQGKRPTTQRRVRGLWSINDVAPSDPFEEFRDETLEHIFSFLDLADLCRAGMVGRRWRFTIHQTSALWDHIDATAFVQEAYQNFKQNSEETGKALEAAMLKPPSLSASRSSSKYSCKRQPKSLTIRSIHQSLSASSYLPSITSLQKLTLTHFDDLTDTHVHVMLLMSQLEKKQSNELKELRLEYCPRLTNASIRSITATCGSLTKLSLIGNARMTDGSTLAPLLSVKTKPLADIFQTTAVGTGRKKAPPGGLHSSASRTTSLTSFQSLFSPPPPSTPIARPVTPPPVTPPADNTSSLQSLFAPPGMSPPRKSVTLQRQTSTSSNSGSFRGSNNSINNLEGTLKHLNLQGTNISAQSVIRCVNNKTSSPSDFVQLKTLVLDGGVREKTPLEGLFSTNGS